MKFSYIAGLSVLIPFIAGILKWSSLNQTLRLLVFYLFFILVKESYGIYLAANSIPNLDVYNIARIVTYLFFFYIYFREYDRKLDKGIAVAFGILTTVVYFIDLLYINGLNQLNFYLTTTGGILVIITVALYFYQLARKLEYTNLSAAPMFWLSSGLLFYYSGTILIFSFFNDYMITNQKAPFPLWNINSVLLILLNLLTTTALLLASKKEK